MGAASLAALPYREIWAVDFEFSQPPGERPDPACLVALELRSGRKIRLWRDELGPSPPYPTDAGSLFVAYFATAELNCHRALGWPIPERILDLFIEFRDHTNGLLQADGKRQSASLLSALVYFGLDHIGAVEKEEMRQKFIKGGNFNSWSESERREGLDYCESDVQALVQLLPAMLGRRSNSNPFDLPRALLRGRYMAAVSAMEFAGVPIDVWTLNILEERWTDIQDRLIADIDSAYGVYDGRSFKEDRFEAFLAKNGIAWARHETGRLQLDDDTFRQAAKAYPIISPLRELRSSLSEMRLSDLAVGKDGRNRTLLSPFGSSSSRNTPSNTRFIFGPSVWLRGLIKPPPGHGVAYIDWSQQEFGIAAALSGDAAMMAAYMSGDPYIAFAKQAGAVPEWATKETHGPQRDLFKTCVLGVQYGMGANTLAERISGGNQYPHLTAKDLLQSHRKTYSTFWRWSDQNQDHAMLLGFLQTVFGWHVHVGNVPNCRSLRNFPVQANGAEMMRTACCLATERGVQVVAPIHDALMIMAPLDHLDEDILRTKAAMAEASRAVLGGFELRADCKEFDKDGKLLKFPGIIRYPNRYMDERGAVMWDRVMALVGGRYANVRA